MVLSRRMSDLASASEDRCFDRNIPWAYYFRAVTISCDRYEGASILSADSFLVSAGEVLEQVAEHLWLHVEFRGSACPGQARSVWSIWLIWFVWFIWLIWFIWLVSFN
jgi:hypothetical protein